MKRNFFFVLAQLIKKSQERYIVGTLLWFIFVHIWDLKISYIPFKRDML